MLRNTFFCASFNFLQYSRVLRLWKKNVCELLNNYEKNKKLPQVHWLVFFFSKDSRSISSIGLSSSAIKKKRTIPIPTTIMCVIRAMVVVIEHCSSCSTGVSQGPLDFKRGDSRGFNLFISNLPFCFYSCFAKLWINGASLFMFSRITCSVSRKKDIVQWVKARVFNVF